MNKFLLSFVVLMASAHSFAMDPIAANLRQLMQEAPATYAGQNLQNLVSQSVLAHHNWACNTYQALTSEENYRAFTTLHLEIQSGAFQMTNVRPTRYDSPAERLNKGDLLFSNYQFGADSIYSEVTDQAWRWSDEMTEGRDQHLVLRPYVDLKGKVFLLGEVSVMNTDLNFLHDYYNQHIRFDDGSRQRPVCTNEVWTGPRPILNNSDQTVYYYFACHPGTPQEMAMNDDFVRNVDIPAEIRRVNPNPCHGHCQGK